MVTLTFDFNQDKVKAAGLTEDELLQPMREHAKKYGIDEESRGVFSKNGENALSALLKFVSDKTLSDATYIDFFNKWILRVDNDEEEDCVEETKKWYAKHGIPGTKKMVI